jgi:phage shock protein PspC (stress-responsive transcriptional regulator)
MTSTPAPTEGPRRLERTTSDRMIAGVAGGLGRYFGLDPVLFRIAFGISILFGGLGLLAYIALVAFLPSDDGEPSWIEQRSRATTIVATVALAIAAVSFLGPPAFLLGPGLLALAVLGLLAVLLYRAFGGQRGDDASQVIARATLAALGLVAALGAATGVGFVAAIGGGVAVAIIAIAAGFALIAAGLVGGPQWLILPAIVLVLPLAVVSAADIDLHGGVGDRDYRPASVAALKPEYRVGAGRMVLDLRGLDLPASTRVKLVVGVGEAVVRVPAGACVATDAQIGVGAADLPGGENRGGLDVTVDHAAQPSARPVVHLNADIGVGHLQIERDKAIPEPVCT